MLEARALSYVRKGKALIRDISLKFQPGILYGILGPNGAGKSTLLKALTGIWTPTSGSVWWREQDLLKQSRREISRTISLVPQNPHLHFDFSVEEVVLMGRYPHGVYNHNSDVLEWALRAVDVWQLRYRLVNSLSSGEKQRIFIARALMTESPVLLLDEPTANLDIRHQLEIWDLLRQLLQKDKVIIVTSHDLNAVARNCDQVAVMHQGQCVGIGDFESVMQPELIFEVFGVTSEQLASTHS